MIGYIFETTNKVTGKKYLGKRYSVAFDKKFLGDMDDLAKDIEKYGRPSFEVKMIWPYESVEDLDNAFENMTIERKQTKNVVVKEEIPEEVEEVKEVKPARRKRKTAEEK